MSRFADIILPLPLAQTFTYAVPEALAENVVWGSRVIVPFGPKKFYTGVVVNTQAKPEGDFTIKEIISVLDEQPIVTAQQIELWKWMAQYYMCTVGDVMKAALPSGLKLQSDSRICIPDDGANTTELDEKEQSVWNTIAQQKSVSVDKLQSLTGEKHIASIIRRLLTKDAIRIHEEVAEKYKPKQERCIKLTEDFLDAQRLKGVRMLMNRSPKQLALLDDYLHAAEAKAAIRLHNISLLKEVKCKAFMEQYGYSMAVLNAVVQRGVLDFYKVDVERQLMPHAEPGMLHPLNDAQQKAFNDIVTSLQQKGVTLLHGVTASGKTEVYMHLIQKVIDEGKQVLYLVPEIALTTQLAQRLQRVFGQDMVVYHSKYPDNIRVEIWQKQLSDHAVPLVLGARSALLLPFKNLGLVIVDEEHEQSYKQQDPSPRYNARDTAIVLAKQNHCGALLGTATPNTETWFNAHHNKYGLVMMNQRFTNVEPTQMEVVDIGELHHKKRMKGAFAPQLLDAIQTALEKKEQVILFQNRRGFAPVVECHDCGWVPRCEHCDVALTYHKKMDRMTCHYCGETYLVPKQCPACGCTELKPKGYGTEKIEEELQLLFPQARIARMDLDTAHTQQQLQQLINQFQNHLTDILIGTQMVTKGLDFNNVSLVGILNADAMLTQPDFRSTERAFQLLIQVAGRAGRGQKPGRVMIQTKQPQLPIIQQVIDHQMEGFYNEQLTEREMFNYPPFTRLVYIYLRHKDKTKLEGAANSVANALKNNMGNRILGPSEPPVGRVSGLYIQQIICKMQPNDAPQMVKDYLWKVMNYYKALPDYSTINFYFDVDPL